MAGPDDPAAASAIDVAGSECLCALVCGCYRKPAVGERVAVV